MRKLLLASCMTLAAFPAWAISRYDTGHLSCGRVQSIIRSEGAVILRYPSRFNPGRVLFDRYVSDDRFCDSDKYAKLTTIPTADNPHCEVLFCQQRSSGGFSPPGGRARMR